MAYWSPPVETHRATSARTEPSAADVGAGEDRIAAAVRGFRQGRDRDRNFAVLFESCHRRVERFFARKGFAAEDCLDLTQETFLGIYKGLERFRLDARFETWLFSVAGNIYLKRLRSRATAKRSGEEVPAEEGKLAATTRSANAQLAGVLAEEKRLALEEAMAELPAKMRRCLELRVYQEMRYREIAVVLRVSVDTVKTHMFQARKKLRARLGEIFGKGWDF